MIFKQSNRTDAEQVFIVCRNITGATVSAGAPVEWDVVTATDGNAVTQSKSGSLAGLFAGISHDSLADSACGLVQVYGFRTSAWVSGSTAAVAIPGQFLIPVSGYLDNTTMSAATTSGHVFCSMMETISTTAVQQANIFIRAM